MTNQIRHIIAGLLTALAVGWPCVIDGGLFSGIWGCLAGVIAGGVKEWCDNVYDGRWTGGILPSPALGLAWR